MDVDKLGLVGLKLTFLGVHVLDKSLMEAKTTLFPWLPKAHLHRVPEHFRLPDGLLC